MERNTRDKLRTTVYQWCLSAGVISLEHTVIHWSFYQTSSLSLASRSVVNRKKQRLVKVGTFNVGTLRTDFRAFELQKLAADLKIDDVLVIQEHRRSKSDVDFQRTIHGELPEIT